MDLRDFDRMPPVAIAMTPFPHFVHVDSPVSEVERLMNEHGVRHVPVKDGPRVVGLISERDLRRLVAPELPASDKARIRARELIAGEPYVVDLHTPLNLVLREMAERKVGSAIVVRDGKLAGILSVTDVARLLASILEMRFGSDGGGDAA